jgi:hypothetical protein
MHHTAVIYTANVPTRPLTLVTNALLTPLTLAMDAYCVPWRWMLALESQNLALVRSSVHQIRPVVHLDLAVTSALVTQMTLLNEHLEHLVDDHTVAAARLLVQ